MTLYHFNARQELPIPLPKAWDFFSDPRRLQDLTPPWLNFHVTSPLPERMYAGMIISYQIRPLGNITMNWVTEITQVQEPVLFVDEQRFGPYKFWHHQHQFKEIAGGVEMTDLVHYALPYGLLGRLAHHFNVAARLREIFRFRQTQLEQFFGSMAGGPAGAALF